MSTNTADTTRVLIHAGDRAIETTVDHLASVTGTQPRELVTGGDPTARPDIPDDQWFVDHDDAPFLPAHDIATIAAALVAEREELSHLTTATICYLWQRTGGKVCGTAVFGETKKTSKLVRHFAGGADFLVILAADHCRESAMDAWQMEALVYHHLLRCDIDPETGKPATRGPDFAGFVAEVDRYGLWRSDLRRARAAFEQTEMPLLGSF